MSDQNDPVIALLEEMRDLLREEVRLRQVGLEEQRAYQAKAHETLAASAARRERSDHEEAK